MSNKETFHKFVNLFLYATLGTFAGIMLGFVFGFLIYALSYVVSTGSSYDLVPLQVVTFLGMAFGGIIGAVFGGGIGRKAK